MENMNMTPFQRKIKGLTRRKFLPITLHLPNIDESVPIEELTEKFRNTEIGSSEYASILNLIIERHLKLGIHIASRYGALYPNKVEDFIGVMGLSLTRWVRKARHKLIDNNITPYLTTNIHSDILNYIEKDHIVYVAGRTVRQYIITGDPRLEKLPHEISIEVNESDSITKELNHTILAECRNEHEEIMEVKELLNKVTTNIIEKKIIELREQGYSFREIEPQIGYSISSIHIILDNLEKKFNKIYKS